MDFLYDGLGPLGMGVAYKDLPEAILVDQADNVGNPLFVQLVKDIIKQEDGDPCQLVCHELKLGKLKRDQVGFLLSLTPEFLNGISFDFHIEIIFVNALGGVLQHPVFFKVPLQEVGQGGCIELAFICELHVFIPT